MKKLADSCRHADYQWRKKNGQMVRLADMEVYHLTNVANILDNRVAYLEEQRSFHGNAESYKTQRLDEEIESTEEARDTLAEHLADRIQNNLPQQGVTK